MIQRFLNWLFSFRWLYKNKLAPEENRQDELPLEISENERLCRAIFSPINLTKTGKLKSNSFKSPPNKDEVSVNRLNFTTPFFCKTEAKRNQWPPDRTYYGFAIIFQKEVLAADCTTIYTPIITPEKLNYFHADIKIGYIPIKGKELPSKFQKKVDDLVKKTRFYKDPDTTYHDWSGSELK